MTYASTITFRSFDVLVSLYWSLRLSLYLSEFYVAIKEYEGCLRFFFMTGYPNEEVARSMARLYAAELLKGQNVVNSSVPSLYKVMAEQSPETVVNYFNRALGSIDYVHYPIESDSGLPGLFASAFD
jgi:hypothetical protein